MARRSIRPDATSYGIAEYERNEKLAAESERGALAGAEPKIFTQTSKRKEAFPGAILLLSVVCGALFAYMIYNYVLINEHTSVLADLRTEITTLSTEKNDLNTKLDKKNDLEYIKQVAIVDLGMVSIDEIEKEYIAMDFDDVII
ncbi:MAG: hypothetical protein KBT31_05305, partial [Firmicutes bacterium]|nr:hypothetical protein [Candidatus Colimorpha enterica]